MMVMIIVVIIMMMIVAAIITIINNADNCTHDGHIDGDINVVILMAIISIIMVMVLEIVSLVDHFPINTGHILGPQMRSSICCKFCWGVT